MATFSQWWTTFNKNQKIHENYWICGTETVLVEEVIHLIKSNHKTKAWNYKTYNVGVESEEDIWQSLFSDAIDSGNSLSIVRSADKLQRKDLILKLITKKLATHVVIFVSNEQKIERYTVESEDGKRKLMPPTYLEKFEPKGKIVECISFSQSTAKTAVAWIKTKVEAKDGALVHLLNESGGDMRIVRDVIQKLRWLSEPATIRNVDYFLSETPNSEFVNALVSLDKETALKSLRAIQKDDKAQIVGLLDAQIDLAGRIHDMQSERKTISEIMKLIGPQAFLVPEMSKSAKYYTKERRLHIRMLLAETDKRIRTGIQEGIFESLVVLW